MSPRRILKLVHPHERRRLRRWLVWCLLIAAAVNVPFAVSRVVVLGSGSPRGATPLSDDDIPETWPIQTPHAEPWPAPTSWSEHRSFGKSYFHIGSSSTEPIKSSFSMLLRRTGWPLPVLEHYQMWWDWDSPALEDVPGIDSDPPMHLMPAGLIANPIIVGTGTWILIVAGFLLTVVRRRAKRLRKGLCLKCGYDLAGLQEQNHSGLLICPECGTSRDEPEGATT